MQIQSEVGDYESGVLPVVHKEEECDSRVGRHYMYVSKPHQRRSGGTGDKRSVNK